MKTLMAFVLFTFLFSEAHAGWGLPPRGPRNPAPKPPPVKRCVPGKIDKFNAKYRTFRTGYYPDSSRMEGGYVDREGNPLRTLQDYVSGRVKYVSIAMDHTDKRFPYGTIVRIPEVEEHFGKCIEFRVVDSGGRFTGRREKKVDICNSGKNGAHSDYSNGPANLYVVASAKAEPGFEDDDRYDGIPGADDDGARPYHGISEEEFDRDTN